jgi:L-alanine-DL-glutamate epimerase-like enolase superfamily enzyme
MRIKMPYVRVNEFVNGKRHVTPTSDRLKYLNLASLILKEPLRIEEGRAVIPDAPGNSIEWDE